MAYYLLEEEQTGIIFSAIVPVIAISIIKQIDRGAHIAIIANTNCIRCIPICIQEFISIDVDCSTICHAVKADEVMSKRPTIESAVADCSSISHGVVFALGKLQPIIHELLCVISRAKDAVIDNNLTLYPKINRSICLYFASGQDRRILHSKIAISFYFDKAFFGRRPSRNFVVRTI